MVRTKRPSTGLRKYWKLSDKLIELQGFYSIQDYPYPLRLIRYYDAETDKELVFLANNMKLAALTITRIYKARWRIEIFFKRIKQNLKIKIFLGTSTNAVLTQIWVAMCYYLLWLISNIRQSTNICSFSCIGSSVRPF